MHNYIKTKIFFCLVLGLFIIYNLFFIINTSEAHEFSSLSMGNGNLQVQVTCSNKVGHPVADKYDVYWDFPNPTPFTQGHLIGGSVVHTYSAAGTYTIHCVSRSGVTALEVASITINVASRNLEFTSTQIPNTLTVNFNVTLSGGPPPPGFWTWDYGDGNSGGVPSHTYGSAGNYTVVLWATFSGFVTDQFHEGAPLTMVSGMKYGRLNFVNVLQPLTANAGLDQTINLGDNANLTGSATGGTPPYIGYSWTKLSGPGTVTFSPNPNTQNPTASFSLGGTYMLQLEVGDSNFDTDLDEMEITVTAAVCKDVGNLNSCSSNADCCSPIRCDLGFPQYCGKADFRGSVGGTPCGQCLPGQACSGQCVINVGQSVVFTDMSDKNQAGVICLNSWGWDFDASGSEGVPPTATGQGSHTVTYNSAGTYPVDLNVGGCYGDGEFKSAYIVVQGGGSTAPTANFSMLNGGLPVPPVNVGDTLDFTDLSTPFDGAPQNAIVARSWNFGDGATLSCPPNPMASCLNPSHQYTSPGGPINIVLLVSDEGSVIDGVVSPDSESNQITKQITVLGGPPIIGSITINNGDAVTTSPNVRLDFTCAIGGTACDAGDEMRFSNLQADLSAAPIQAFTAFIDPWSITPPAGDGIKAVYIQFRDGGTPTWSSTFVDTITLSTNGPTACFAETVNNFQVNFSSSCSTPGDSSPITLWEWTFGDGVTLSGFTLIEQNPPHTYPPVKGSRTATLVVTDNIGVKSAPFSKTFFVGPPILDFNLEFPNILNATTTEGLIEGIIDFLSWIIIPLAVLLIIYAAFRYMIAGAIPAERVKAIQIIQYALIGIVVVLLARIIKGLIEFLLE